MSESCSFCPPLWRGRKSGELPWRCYWGITLALLASKWGYTMAFDMVFIISFHSLYLCTRTLKLLTPAYLYFFFYTIYCYVWALSIFITAEDYSIGEVCIAGHGYDLLLATSLGLVCFSFGVLIATAVSRFKPYHELLAFRRKEWVDDMRGIPFVVSITLLTLLGLSLSIIFFSIRGIPILAYTDAMGTSHFFGEMSEARVTAQWGAGCFMQGITLILPFCAFVLYAKGFVSHQKVFKIWALFLSMLSIVMMIALTSRGHFVIFLVLLFLLHQFLAKQINWRKAFLFFSTVVVLFLVVSVFKMGYFLTLEDTGHLLSNALEILSYRLSLGTQQFHAILQTFPDAHAFILGKGYLWDIAGVLPGPDIGFNGWIFTLIYPLGLEGNTVNPLSLGEFYANFGWSGIIVGSILLGVFLQMLYIGLIRSKGSLSHLVAFVVFSTYLAKSSMNGLGAISEPIISMTCSYCVLVGVYHCIGIICRKMAVK